MSTFVLQFEWDPAKAAANLVQHGIDFERASQVFGDPLALTIPDDEHSIAEVRWITMGRDWRGQTILVVHTFVQSEEAVARVRIISARRSTKSEAREYEGPQ